MREHASASHLVRKRSKKDFPAQSISAVSPSPRIGREFSTRIEPALNHAYKLLSYRGRSEKELRQRLILKGFDEHAVDSVITALTANGFLDDRKLAFALKRYAAESKHLGIWGTKNFLRDRGIPKEIIEEAMHDVDETEGAWKIAQKMMRSVSSLTAGKSARKIYGALYRRGYSPETIRKTLYKFTLREDM